jgi:hypothetical protein
MNTLYVSGYCSHHHVHREFTAAPLSVCYTDQCLHIASASYRCVVYVKLFNMKCIKC